jgi:hypothetical protein
MKPRHEFTTDNFTARCPPSRNVWQRILTLCAVTFLSATCAGCGDSPGKGPEEKADLPEMSAFLTKPSDRFLVDIKEVSRGHPFLGVDSPRPHAGGHVHFDNTKNRWPKGKHEPSNYPAILYSRTCRRFRPAQPAQRVVKRSRFGVLILSNHPLSPPPASASCPANLTTACLIAVRIAMIFARLTPEPFGLQ